MERVKQLRSSRSDNSQVVLVQALRAIEDLSAELDRTRAERDQLKALVDGPRGKANFSEAA